MFPSQDLISSPLPPPPHFSWIFFFDLPPLFQRLSRFYSFGFVHIIYNTTRISPPIETFHGTRVYVVNLFLSFLMLAYYLAYPLSKGMFFVCFSSTSPVHNFSLSIAWWPFRATTASFFARLQPPRDQ